MEDEEEPFPELKRRRRRRRKKRIFFISRSSLKKKKKFQRCDAKYRFLWRWKQDGDGNRAENVASCESWLMKVPFLSVSPFPLSLSLSLSLSIRSAMNSRSIRRASWSRRSPKCSQDRNSSTYLLSWWYWWLACLTALWISFSLRILRLFFRSTHFWSPLLISK